MMTHLSPRARLAAAGAAGVAGAPAAVTTADRDDDERGGRGGRVLEYTTRATAINRFTDIGTPGPGPGDGYVWRDDLFEARGARAPGSSRGGAT
jgi:hypothetical protein